MSRELLAGFFVAVERSFQLAVANCGAATFDCRIAGQVVRFRFAGPGLVAAIMPAFAHLSLRSPSAEPDLTVALWDSATTNVSMPAPLWSTEAYTARGDLRGFEDERYRTSFHTPSGVFTILDMERGLAVCWVSDAHAVPSYVRAMPLLPVFQWWMASRHCQLLHGGLVGTPEGAVFLAGKGRAGKSNTALACLGSDLLYGGDDFCLVELGTTPRAHSLFCSGRLHPPDLERLPFLRPALSNPDRLNVDKALFFLHERFSERLAASFPLRGLLLPRVCDRHDTTWEPAPPSAAHRALVAVTLHHLPGAGEAALQTISQMVRRFPCYYLNLGRDVHRAPAAIRDILAEWT